MTLKQTLLAKIRAWIDRRLPRDVLTIHILPDAYKRSEIVTPNGERLVTLTAAEPQEAEYWTHPELILRAKMGGDTRYVRTFEGRIHIIFGTEHLSP